MSIEEDEEKLLRSVALQNSRAILLARERAERGLVQATEALRLSNERVSNILDSITDGFFALDNDWRVTFLNREGEQMLRPLRKPGATLIGEIFWEEIPETLASAIEENFRQAVRTQSTVQFETFYAPLQAWFDVRAFPSPDGLSVYFHDVTERKRAEAEVRRQQEWFKVTLSSIGDAVIATDTEGKVTFLNPVAEEMTGWNSAEAAGCKLERVFEIVSEITGDRAPDPVQSALEQGIPVGLANHTALISRAGKRIAIEDSAAPIKDGSGRVAGAVLVFHDVTERRRAQEALRRSEERLRATFNQAAVGIAIASLTGRFEVVNERFARLLGYSPEELTQRTFLELTLPEDRPQTERNMQQLLSGAIQEYVHEKRYLRNDGTEVWSCSSVSLLKDKTGEPEHFIGVIEDITQRKQSEQAIREGAQRLQLALSAGQLGDWSWDARTGRVYLGQKAAEILGLSFNEPMTWPALLESVHEADREAVRQALEQAVADRADYNVEYRSRAPHQKEAWISTKGRPSYGPDGTLLGMIGVVQDVTEVRRAAELRARLAAVVESSDDAIISMTLEGVITTWNRGAERMFGYSAQELIGKHVSTLIPPNREDEEPAILERLKRGERIDHYETIRMRRDGSLLHVSLTVSPIHDADGKVVGVSKISRDITERKRAEEMLLEEARVLELINSTGQAISSQLEVEKLVQTVTDAATQLSGARFGAFFYNVTNEQGESFLLYTLSGAPRQAYEEFDLPRNTALFNPTFRGEGIVRSDDITKDPRYGTLAPHWGMPAGHLPVRSYLAVPVVSRTGAVIGGLFFGHPERGVFTQRSERLVVAVAAQAAIAIDNARLYDAAQKEIAHRKEVEGALRQAQDKLEQHAQQLEAQVTERTASLRETIGELETFSYSISHDMRAPLRSMQSFAMILGEECAGQLPEEGKEYIRRIARAAERMDRLIQDILTYSRVARAELRLQPTDVEKLLRDILDTYPAFQAAGAEIQLRGPFPLVLGAEAVLTQCFSNLLSNAVKFVLPGTTPKVQVWPETFDDRKMVRLFFKDNGVGIDPESHGKIFGIFQRLDNRYEGTGIGLAIVKKGAERMGGTVGFDSKAGAGSTFWLELGRATPL